MRYHEAEDVYEKAEELARREGKGVSEIVLKSLSEYLKVHYPGQPQPPLLETEAKIRQYFADRLKARLSQLLEKRWPDVDAWRREVDRVLVRIRETRVRDLELDQLVTQATEND